MDRNAIILLVVSFLIAYFSKSSSFVIHDLKSSDEVCHIDLRWQDRKEVRHKPTWSSSNTHTGNNFFHVPSGFNKRFKFRNEWTSSKNQYNPSKNNDDSIYFWIELENFRTVKYEPKPIYHHPEEERKTKTPLVSIENLLEICSPPRHYSKPVSPWLQEMYTKIFPRQNHRIMQTQGDHRPKMYSAPQKSNFDYSTIVVLVQPQNTISSQSDQEHNTRPQNITEEITTVEPNSSTISIEGTQNSSNEKGEPKLLDVQKYNQSANVQSSQIWHIPQNETSEISNGEVKSIEQKVWEVRRCTRRGKLCDNE